MIGRVGDDGHGEECVANLKSLGVNTAAILKTPSAPTGTAAITVDKAGENMIIVVAGANDELSTSDVSSLGGAFDSSQALICQLEIPVSTVLQAMQLAQSHGKTIYFNPSPCPKEVETILPLLSLADVVVPNQGELGLLASLPTSNDEQCIAAARKLLLAYPNLKAIITTLGSNGSIHVTNRDEIKCPPARLKAPVVDTVGAGDCFLATIAYELERGNDPLEAMTRANLLASRSITKEGAMESYRGILS